MTPTDRPTLRVAVHQPGYHRHLYYFAKMAAADVFVSLDCVQYRSREWQNRQAFWYGGRRNWLTVPVGAGREPIRRKRLADPAALVDHWALIRRIYRRTPAFDWLAPQLEAVYAQPWEYLVDLCDALTDVVRRALDIRTPCLSASELLPDTGLARGELLAALCGAAAVRIDPTGVRPASYLACATPMRADHYLRRVRPDGTGRTELDCFGQEGIQVRTFADRRPVYRQHQLPRGSAFEPELAACDLLFNHGSTARTLLLGDPSGPVRTEPVG